MQEESSFLGRRHHVPQTVVTVDDHGQFAAAGLLLELGDEFEDAYVRLLEIDDHAIVFLASDRGERFFTGTDKRALNVRPGDQILEALTLFLIMFDDQEIAPRARVVFQAIEQCPTRELTRLLGGQMSVQSEVNEGSTFTLYLPASYIAASVSKPVTQVSDLPVRMSRPAARSTTAVPALKAVEVSDDRDTLKPGEKRWRTTAATAVELCLPRARNLARQSDLFGRHADGEVASLKSRQYTKQFAPVDAIVDRRLGFDDYRGPIAATATVFSHM
jgi:hypothetical protein